MANKKASSNLPSYSTLMLSLEESTSPKVVEHGINVTKSLARNFFEDNNATVIFSQKVLCIVFLQTIVVDLVMEIFLSLEIFTSKTDWTHLFMEALVLYTISLCLMLSSIRSRRKAICNYIILVYQPIALTSTTILVMRGSLNVGHYGQDLLEMFCITWKSCIFSGLAILIYTIFSLNSKDGISLLHSTFIATGVFTASYLYTIFWYATKSTGPGPYTNFYINLVFYLMYMYILYDIDSMTKRDYRPALGPDDYVNSGANLQFDFIFVFIKVVKRGLCCCFVKNEQYQSDEYCQ